MIGKITTGTSFKPLMYYLLKDDKSPKIIGGNMLASTPAGLISSFQTIANFRPSTRKPVKHYSLGFAPQDGEVSDEIKADIAEKIVEQMGFTAPCSYDPEDEVINNQYLVVAHGRQDPAHEYDHEHDHIHIVINLVNLDGKRINDGWDKRRLEKVLRKLEKEYGLTPVVSSGEVRKSLSEKTSADNNGNPEIEEAAQALRETVQKEYPRAKDLTEFLERMERLGINIEQINPSRGIVGYKYTPRFANFQLIKQESKKTPEISDSTRLYVTDRQRQQSLTETKKAIATAVAKHTQDSPDFFVFARRMRQEGIETIQYRTAGGKRSGRYKLKYRFKGGIEIRAGKQLGGSFAELINSQRIKFDPKVHYGKEAPPDLTTDRATPESSPRASQESKPKKDRANKISKPQPKKNKDWGR